jgi:hypothetical protein
MRFAGHALSATPPPVGGATTGSEAGRTGRVGGLRKRTEAESAAWTAPIQRLRRFQQDSRLLHHALAIRHHRQQPFLNINDQQRRFCSLNQHFS